MLAKPTDIDAGIWHLVIADVQVREGRRHINGSRVEELVKSIDEIGLLQPIVVTKDNVLIAGHHRLLACKALKWETIPAVVLDASEVDAKIAEIDENLVREDLLPSERAKLTAERKALYLAKYPETGHGKAPGAKGSAKGGKVRAPEPVEESEEGGGKDDNLSSLPGDTPDEAEAPAFTEDTASKSGKNRRTVERDVRRGEKVAPDVLENIAGTDWDTGENLDVLSKLEHERQAALLAFAIEKKVKNLKQALRDLKRHETKEKINQEPQPLPTGPFRVIVADPPWKYFLREEDETHRGTVDYSSMTVEEICRLPVSIRAHTDCVLWLWTTNAHLPVAFDVVKEWGFTYKTMLTWFKSKIGVGHWLRGQTEHCLLAVKGNPTIMLSGQSTALQGEVREHSRKPESFYELVEGLCPGAKLEMFGREQREGWVVWGAENEKF
jgi:N6-adenosine-specific RNA methylase IME4